MSEEKKEEGHEGAAPKKGKKKLIIIVAGVLVLIAGAGIPLMMMGGDAPKAHDEEEVEEVKHYETVKLDPFIVNLSANSAFLKVSMLLEYDPALLHLDAHGEGGGGGHGGGSAGGGGAAPAGLPGPMAAREPMMRDAIIRVLSSKRVEDVLTTEGKERLKEELVETINESIGLEEGPVVNIYFTEFMVQ